MQGENMVRLVNLSLKQLESQTIKDNHLQCMEDIYWLQNVLEQSRLARISQPLGDISKISNVFSDLSKSNKGNKSLSPIFREEKLLLKLSCQKENRNRQNGQDIKKRTIDNLVTRLCQDQKRRLQEKQFFEDLRQKQDEIEVQKILQKNVSKGTLSKVQTEALVQKLTFDAQRRQYQQKQFEQRQIALDGMTSPVDID